MQSCGWKATRHYIAWMKKCASDRLPGRSEAHFLRFLTAMTFTARCFGDAPKICVRQWWQILNSPLRSGQDMNAQLPDVFRMLAISFWRLFLTLSRASCWLYAATNREWAQCGYLSPPRAFHFHQHRPSVPGSTAHREHLVCLQEDQPSSPTPRFPRPICALCPSPTSPSTLWLNSAPRTQRCNMSMSGLGKRLSTIRYASAWTRQPLR